MLQRMILLLCICFSLSGCIASALVIGATAGGAIVYDKRSFKTIAQDRHSTEYAQSAIDYSKKLKGHAHISIATFNHIMLMVGQADTPELREYAYQLVSKVKYVQRFYNEVVVGRPISFMRRTKDGWITTKVKTAMLAAKRLNSTQIKVITENGVVYLLGLVTRHQGQLATNVARRIAGVKKVVKVFQYT